MIKINTIKPQGMTAEAASIEIEKVPGVGIHCQATPQVAVKEALLLALTALSSIGCNYQQKGTNIKTTPWNGVISSRITLPLAIGLHAMNTGESFPCLDRFVIVGSVRLDGSVDRVGYWMQAAEVAKQTGRALILPTESANLAADVFGDEVDIYGVGHLEEAFAILKGDAPERFLAKAGSAKYPEQDDNLPLTWSLLRMDPDKVRAIEIAAAGGHSMMLLGVPGSGKAMCAKALTQVLPPMTEEENRETQRAYSFASESIRPGVRPFLMSSHLSFTRAYVGDHSSPGLMPLAHNGVLFLHDLSCIAPAVKEIFEDALRKKSVSVAYQQESYTYPARFIGVFAANTCACGYDGEGDRCTCTPGQKQAYLNKLTQNSSFVTMQVKVKTAPKSATQYGDTFSEAQAKVANARAIQLERNHGCLNEDLESNTARAILSEDENTNAALFDYIYTLLEKMHLPCRAITAICKIARTIADLEGAEDVAKEHILEAVNYRTLDKLESDFRASL